MKTKHYLVVNDRQYIIMKSVREVNSVNDFEKERNTLRYLKSD